jgi:hypothetical protein
LSWTIVQYDKLRNSESGAILGVQRIDSGDKTCQNVVPNKTLGMQKQSTLGCYLLDYIGASLDLECLFWGSVFIARNIPLMTSCAFAMYQQFLLVSNSF